MTPQKKIRIGVGFVAIWVLLGGAWLCDYFFGDTEFWKLASGELTVLLGIGAGTAMIREGRRGQEAENAAAKTQHPEIRPKARRAKTQGRRPQRHRPKRPGWRNTGRRVAGREHGSQKHGSPHGAAAGREKR